MFINGIEIEQPTREILKKQLKIQGRSCGWLADMAGFSYSYTNRLLNGHKPLLENHIQILSELLELPLTPKKLNP